MDKNHPPIKYGKTGVLVINLGTPDTTNWFDITLDGQAKPGVDFSSSSAVNYYNFSGVYQQIRYSWGNSSGNTGSVDKILYRQ